LTEDADIQPPVSRPPLSISGFFGAAGSAPGLAVIVCISGAVAMSLVSGEIANPWGSALFGLIFLSLIATVWGVVPSVAFGGLVLAIMRRMPWRRRPATVEYTVAGVVAAGLYVLAGLGIGGLSPGAAMLFAPWATTDLWGSNGSWWIAASILLAGAAAGLLYAVCVKRG